jgi:hypothetical protein
MSDKTKLAPEWMAEAKRVAETANRTEWNLVVKGNSIQSYAIPGVCSGISPTSGNGAYLIMFSPPTVLALLALARRGQRAEKLEAALEKAKRFIVDTDNTLFRAYQYVGSRDVTDDWAGAVHIDLERQWRASKASFDDVCAALAAAPGEEP